MILREEKEHAAFPRLIPDIAIIRKPADHRNAFSISIRSNLQQERENGESMKHMRGMLAMQAILDRLQQMRYESKTKPKWAGRLVFLHCLWYCMVKTEGNAWGNAWSTRVEATTFRSSQHVISEKLGEKAKKKPHKTPSLILAWNKDTTSRNSKIAKSIPVHTWRCIVKEVRKFNQLVKEESRSNKAVQPPR